MTQGWGDALAGAKTDSGAWILGFMLANNEWMLEKPDKMGLFSRSARLAAGTGTCALFDIGPTVGAQTAVEIQEQCFVFSAAFQTRAPLEVNGILLTSGFRSLIL